ncbi:MAG: transglycosylase domain-containing protein [Clostridia bacterium]|nr:transglycosylase domain-containing protein [Clostridia bacterium]
MKNEGKKRRRRRILLPLSILFLLSVVAVTVYLVRVEGGIDYAMDERLFLAAGESRTTQIYVNENTKGETYLPVELKEEALYGGENCIFVPIEEIPSALGNAFVAIEDHRFYDHRGVDLLRTAKASLNFILKFDRRFGGSTITQQLIKNIGGEREVRITRKVREIMRALHLERTHSKEEILEAYLNIVPLSRNCIGVGAAARTYFQKEASELSLLECVTLAAITNSPARYDPVTHPENNAKRRKLILDAMLKHGYIDQNEYEEAVSAEPQLHVQKESGGKRINSWYTDVVIGDVINDLCERKGYSQEAASKLVYSGGLRIYTLMDTDMQKHLESYFSDLSHFPKDKNGSRPTYAMTVVDPRNGNLLAVVGNIGKKSGNRLLSYAVDVKRPPGSTTKPLALYAPLIESGTITEASVFDDVPLDFKANGGLWPQNANRVYSGLITVRDAIRLSKNTTAVELYRMQGAERVYRTLSERLGLPLLREGHDKNGKFVTDLAESPLALGQWTSGITLRDITAAYVPFANGGIREDCRSYAAVYGANGELLLSNPKDSRRVWSRETAGLMTNMLCDVTENGTAKTLKLKDLIDVAGKTGTSGSYRDRWFVGYTPYLVAGIWCGYPDHTSMASLPATHLTVWDEVMKELHRDVLGAENEQLRTFQIPRTLLRVEYCKDSGKLPCEACGYDVRGKRTRVGYFIRGTEPTEPCDRHVLVPYDKDGGVARPECFWGAPDGEISYVSLLSIPTRDFPRQIFITDAQYVMRDIEMVDLPTDPTVPFFANTLKDGRYVGISMTSDGRQFNAACTKHTEADHGQTPPQLKFPFEFIIRSSKKKKNMLEE